MKAAVIILGALCAILVYAIFQRGATASRKLESVLKDSQTASNQLADARTSLGSARAESTATVSNLQHRLDKRTADLNVVSNRLVQTHLLLQAAQTEARHGQEQIVAGVVRITNLENENAALRPNAERPSAADQLTRERDAARRQLAEITRERDALQTQLGAVNVENETLQTQLFDVAFLERQLKDAKVAADIRRRMASAPAGSTDPRMKLELQQDGTVRLLRP